MVLNRLDSVNLVRFVEKPKLDLAQELLGAGNFLWNSGIFLFSARTILGAFTRHSPGMIEHVTAAIDDAEADLGFIRLAAQPWSKIKSISVDFAVMEKADNLKVVPFSGSWSDLGDWQAVWRADANVDED